MGRDIPRILTQDEREALLDVFSERYDSPFRNKCIIALMLSTGLRPSEVTDLKPVHLRDEGRIVVRDGKGNKDRSVWAGQDVVATLTRWRERAPESEWLFCTSEGHQIDTRYLRDMVPRYAEKADINEPEEVSPMTMRHTFATELYRSCGRIQVVSRALGHEDVSTTMIYTHIVDEEVQDAMQSLWSDKKGFPV
ncbi:MAG: tyrosine-type recombinase/integrase [Bradymonadaceae bacterium]